MTRIRWEIGDRLSPLHAARCWAAGEPGIDPALARAISDPLTRLTQRLTEADVDLAMFWRVLVARAATVSVDDSQPARQALHAAGLSELLLDPTASAIVTMLAETRLAFQERLPKLAQQLDLRGRPLRQQWEAYGPGLLRQIGRQTHESFIPKSATVLLLAPYRGGDGDCNPAAGTLWVEAVLTHPVPEVPEVLRLAWLITRIGLTTALNQGDPEQSAAAVDRRRELVGLALLPAVLQAGAELELCPPIDQPSQLLGKALQTWDVQADQPLARTLEHWWAQSRQLKPAFPVALKALEKMLVGQPSLDAGRQS